MFLATYFMNFLHCTHLTKRNMNENNENIKYSVMYRASLLNAANQCDWLVCGPQIVADAANQFR